MYYQAFQDKKKRGGGDWMLCMPTSKTSTSPIIVM
jgi:hypothetical protein